MPGPGVEPPTSGMPSGRANHYTTAPLSTLPRLSVHYRASQQSSFRRTIFVVHTKILNCETTITHKVSFWHLQKYYYHDY